ncbi:MAG: DUF3108 domain-containing protein [Acidobacteriota bacterium]|nr:DUF3108 domain-containing protein [Acidobacteriota bacterium]
MGTQLLCIFFATQATAATAPSGFPFADEDLNYSINWPSGLSLGEAHMRARHSGTANPPQWEFSFNVDASLPGFQVLDRYTSTAAGDLCSVQFDRVFTHGSKKSNERTVVDTPAGTATRTTASGGKTEIPISGCIRDALTFLFYARRELGQGRVPPAQTILFGSAYQAHLEYTGAQTIPVNDVPTQADRVVCNFKGPASDLEIEIFFARDAARTPLLVRAPFAIGNFSMELLR